MTEPISIMKPFDSRPKTVTISVELSDAYVALTRAAESCYTMNFIVDGALRDAHQKVIKAGGGK